MSSTKNKTPTLNSNSTMNSTLEKEINFLEQTIGYESILKEEVLASDHSSSLVEEMTKNTQERYLTRDLLGHGGFSLVHKVYDVKIGRDIAVKNLNPNATEVMQHTFLLEARIMSQLDHPGILPVYDFIENHSMLDDVTFGYSMRIATHNSLYEYLKTKKIHDHYKICNILIQVSLALEHAHQRGVLHRDIKPHNILLGHEGEVYLTDWGVCTLMPHHPDYRFLSESMKSLIVGTPAYMAPEQIQKGYHKITTVTDVYGLGATLYHTLSGVSPYSESNLSDVLQAMKDGRLITPSEVWKRKGKAFPYPKFLELICLKSLSLNPQDRYQSAKEFADVLEKFTNGELEQERARESAQASYDVGQDHLVHFIKHLNHHSQLTNHVEIARSVYKRSRKDHDRLILWNLENTLDEILNPMEASFAHAISAFQSAIRDLPTHDDSRKSLIQLYKARYQQALEVNDQRMMIFFEERIKEYTTSKELIEFERSSELRLTDLPKGTTVKVFFSHLKRYSNDLIEKCVIKNYTNETIFLKRGRYLIKCIHKEASETRIILWIKKYQQLEIKSPLPKKHSVPPGFVYIKDKLAFGEYPVTISDYYDFLNDISPDHAKMHQPRYHQTAYCGRSENGRFELPYTDIEGDTWLHNWPVMLVSYHDACAYVEWLSKQMSARIRIPNEAEWLEAAGSSDGRSYPWGMNFDTSLCMMRESHEGRPIPVPVGSRKTDCSPYGIYCVAGNICQWVSTQADGISTRKRILGSSYNSMELMCHLQHKMQGNSHETFAHVGIRILIELSDKDFLS